MDPMIIPILGISCGLFAVAGRLIVKPILDYRAQKMDIESRMVTEQMQRETARTERLEQRMAVLERIITDRSGSLADEIERLRDQPLN